MRLCGWENASGILWFMGQIVISALEKIFWGWGDRRRKNYLNRSLLRDCSALKRRLNAHRQATFTDFFEGSGSFASKLDCGIDPQWAGDCLGAELLLHPIDERDLGSGRGVAFAVVLWVCTDFHSICGGASAGGHSVAFWDAP